MSCNHERGKILSYDVPAPYRWLELCYGCNQVRYFRLDNHYIPLTPHTDTADSLEEHF